MSLSRPRRGREEDDSDDGRVGGQGKRLRRCCSCCREAKDFYEGQIEILKKEMERMSKGFIEEHKILQREMRDFYQNSQLQFNEQQQRWIEQIREQFNTFIPDTNTPGDHVKKHNNNRVLSSQIEIRTYRLKFENRCCNDKFSRHVMKADDGNPIKVAIYDHDNRIITNGPLSSMQVRIVVMNGEFNKDNKAQWNRDSFLQNIVNGRPGKPPLFANELYLRLKNGVANLCGAKFQDNSSFVPSKRFRLGVMAEDDSISEKILEGISESFAVKDGRGFSTKKDPYPSLSDPICKLKRIAVNGDRQKLLEEMQIKLVQDFLRFYNKDKKSLREACGNISDNDWSVIVEHALNCKPGHKRYSYCIPEMDVTVFFNSLYNIVGAKFNGIYTSYEELNDNQKGLVEEYRMMAYDNLKVVQHEEKIASNEHQLMGGDKGSCYLRGSCSMPTSPTLPTRFHEEPSHQGEVLQSGPPQASPRPHQRWAKIVTAVTTLRFLEMAAFMRQLPSILDQKETLV